MTIQSSAGSSRLPEETVPLLAQAPKKKPFYRARPLWLVPFALVSSLVRGMTLAPRVEVYMQLSCQQVHGRHGGSHQLGLLPPELGHPYTSSNLSSYHSLDLSIYTPEAPPVLRFTQYTQDTDTTWDPTDDPRNVPSTICVGDPDVQAGAAKLQMIMTTTMGLLSALTTGWWGHFGERHGRTRVLAISTFGLFLTDLVFILVSTPSSVLSHHGHKLLLFAPVIEGVLGGWSTLQAANTAYISDCTSSGSRAHIFSRFTGVLYLGILIGPSIGGYLIQHSAPGIGGTKTVTSVFWTAITCSFINFLLALFVFPESLPYDIRQKAIAEYGSRSSKHGKAPAQNGVDSHVSVLQQETTHKQGLFYRLFSPLAVFLPVKVRDPVRINNYRRDWSLTLLALSFFGFMLCGGVYQLKYLYAEHVYGWGAQQLSWYISYLGGMRALSLLVVLPYLIGLFKPRSSTSGSLVTGDDQAASPMSKVDKAKPPPSRSQLNREIYFDLMLTRFSFFMDLVSNLVIIASPAPAFRHASVPHLMGQGDTMDHPASFSHSQTLFVMASGLASFGTGAAPAVYSLTLCILQARGMVEAGESSAETSAETAKSSNVGGVFGAFAFLQSIGSMILGPLIFGMIYSNTVTAAPKVIFMVASAILCVSIALLMLVYIPGQEGISMASDGGSKVRTKKVKRGRKKRIERGRSRVSKDLRGGAAGYIAEA